MNYLFSKLFMGYFWFRWRVSLASAHGAVRAYKDRGLEDTPVYPYIVGRLFNLETMGVRYGWLREDQRTVTSMPEMHPGFEHFNESGEPGEVPPQQKPN